MDPRNYLANDSLWLQLQKYIKKNHTRYVLTEDCTTQQIIDKLDELADKNLSIARKKGSNDFDKDLFKKAVMHLNSGKSASFRRYDKNYSYDNLYLLCYALGLDFSESIILLRDYLHENALSTRSLKEFIILFGLEKRAPWTSVRRMLNRYDDEITDQRQAQDHTVYGETLDNQRKFLENMKDMNDLGTFLSDSQNLSFFSRLRNTHYLALLDNRVEIDRSQRKKNKYHLIGERNEWNYETMLERYHYLFGLYPAYTDQNTPPEENVSPYLDRSEIEELARIFGDTFLRYSKFCDLVQRKCVVEPCQETYLLLIIENLDDEDYSSKEAFINNCNASLDATGFPTLNPSYAFNRLLLDAYDEADSHHHPVTKSQYLSTLRTALRDIIDCKLHPEKQD